VQFFGYSGQSCSGLEVISTDKPAILEELLRHHAVIHNSPLALGGQLRSRFFTWL
jgi:hypothetical protein